MRAESYQFQIQSEAPRFRRGVTTRCLAILDQLDVENFSGLIAHGPFQHETSMQPTGLKKEERLAAFISEGFSLMCMSLLFRFGCLCFVFLFEF